MFIPQRLHPLNLNQDNKLVCIKSSGIAFTNRYIKKKHITIRTLLNDINERNLTMTNYKKLSEKTFNMQAKTYDTDKNGKHARSLYQHIINELSAVRFSSVLDVGCGTGEILYMLKNIYPAISLYGIDISREMLKQAEDKGLCKVNLLLGDAENLPFENENFDLLVCTDSFHHYPNPQKAINEFYRVLENDGYLLLADFWKPFPIRQLMNLFLPFSSEGDVKIYSINQILNFLKNAGFQDVQYKKVNKSSYLILAKKSLRSNIYMIEGVVCFCVGF